VPLVVTLYDLIPLHDPGRYLTPDLRARYRARLELVQAADLVLAISEFTRQDSLKRLNLDPARVVTVGGGVTPFFRPAPSPTDSLAEVRGLLPRIDRPFVLSVTGGDDRKNTEGLIDAFARLPRRVRDRYRLVVVCRLTPAFEQQWSEHARGAGLDDDELVLTDHVSDDVLRSLYRAAALFVFPSFLEGFGLPVAEAVACDCPTITSDTSSLPEILDWAPSAFDPADPSAIAAVMERGLTDQTFREQLRARGRERTPMHTWAAVAERSALGVASLAPPHRRTPAPRLRVALVGPLPPTRSGIADYNERLVAELATRCDLHVFLPEAATGPPSTEELRGRSYLIRPLTARFNPAAYDAIVYTVGASEHHHNTYDFSRRWPGIVWLHDVRLASFFLTYVASRHPSAAQEVLTGKLVEQYGERVPPQVLGAFDKEAEATYGLGLSADWLRGARAVLVNSHLAEQMLRLDQGPGRTPPPTWRLPFAVPEPVHVEGVTRDALPVIASFGIQHTTKSPELLIAALPLVRHRVDARVALVGPISPEYRRDLRALARQHGVSKQVEITGRVPEIEYQRWLRRVACAVQLRQVTHGESSAALSDCLGAGLPVVTNVIGADREFPPDAVAALDPACTAEEVAERLVALLTDPDLWRRHHEAALAHARASTFAHLADELLRVVAELGRVDGTASVRGG
jgi:glycosyltransferase involved in cell wall biosynthesis